jgi:hypothetical protein
MHWKIIEEIPRKYADESYYLKAECACAEGTLVLEIGWAQIMYALTVDLVKGNKEQEIVYDCMVFCEDRIEKYGHQIMRITDGSPFRTLRRLYSMQKDGVLNYYLGEKYNVSFETKLPKQLNAK